MIIANVEVTIASVRSNCGPKITALCFFATLIYGYRFCFQIGSGATAPLPRQFTSPINITTQLQLASIGNGAAKQFWYNDADNNLFLTRKRTVRPSHTRAESTRVVKSEVTRDRRSGSRKRMVAMPVLVRNNAQVEQSAKISTGPLGNVQSDNEATMHDPGIRVDTPVLGYQHQPTYNNTADSAAIHDSDIWVDTLVSGYPYQTNRHNEATTHHSGIWVDTPVLGICVNLHINPILQQTTTHNFGCSQSSTESSMHYIIGSRSTTMLQDQSRQ